MIDNLVKTMSTRGMDSSYHVQTNMSVRSVRKCNEALAYILYIRKRSYFYLMCTSKEAITFSKVNVDVQ